MILTDSQRELRWQMEIVSFRCLHSIAYFDASTGKDCDFWQFTQNCYGEIACLNWCHLFNSRKKDPVHYWNLFGEDQLINLGEQYSYENIKHRLLSVARLNEDEYVLFRKEVVDFRNMHTSHREYDSNHIIFPRLDIARLMCLEMRVILQDTAVSELVISPNDIDLHDLKRYYDEKNNNWLLKKCRRDIKYHTHLAK